MTLPFRALVTSGLLALQGAGPAPPPGGPVSYLIGQTAVDELWRVAGGQVQERQPLGLNTVFGVSGDRLATLAERAEGGRTVEHLSLFDLKTGSVLSEGNVDVRLLTWMSGPEGVVLVRPREDALYFITLDVDGQSVSNALARLELATGKVTRFKIPPEVSNPRPFELPDFVGAYSWNHGAIALLKDGEVKAIAPRGETARTVVDPSAVSSVLGLAGVGIVRVSPAGKVEIFDPAKGAAPPVRVLALGGPVANPQAATFEGKPVLVYGDAQRGAAGRSVVSALVIYDPVAEKVMWRKKLPWLARTFTVSGDGSLFRLIPLPIPQLTYYDRRSDSFTKALLLKPREVDRVVIVPSE